GKARRRLADEYRSTVADLEAALAGVAEERQALAAEIQSDERERERRRQEKAAEPSRQEIAQDAKAFIDGMVGLCEPLLRRKAKVERFSHQFPLATGIPDLKLDGLARALQSALRLPNDND